jgi:hypothetical protein
MARTVRVTRYYRDSAGRTRIERELSQQPAGPKAALQNVVVEIYDPIRGERYLLFPHTKTAEVLKGGTESHLAQPPFTPPGITAYFGGLTIGPNEHGWSEPESLGEQVMEGVRAVGTRREYILAAGAIGNEKPIGITIEQWFSPDLGMIVSKTGHGTTGGGSSYRLEHIVQGEPDAVLLPFRRTTPAPRSQSPPSNPSPYCADQTDRRTHRPRPLSGILHDLGMSSTSRDGGRELRKSARSSPAIGRATRAGTFFPEVQLGPVVLDSRPIPAMAAIRPTTVHTPCPIAVTPHPTGPTIWRWVGRSASRPLTDPWRYTSV